MANWRIFPNTGGSYVSSAVASGDATISVVSGALFPNPASGQEYKIKVDQEYMLVTGVSGNTLTVTRGVDGSTAATHAIGILVFSCISQDDLLAVQNQCNPPTTSGAPSSPTYTTPFRMAFDPSANKLYIWNGSAWKSVTLT